MDNLAVGVRDLKTRLSEYLRLVKNGQTVLITDHGKPVGRIVPIEASLEQRISVLKQAGLVSWNGQKLAHSQPVAKNTSQNLISDILVEMRE
jgi:prevent-host-death family protein